MTPLLLLAEKVEGLEGPDREVDAEIGLACGIVRERDGNCFFGHRDFSVMVLERGYYDHDGHPPELLAYTASLDAAMSLVPEGDWEPYGSAVSPWNVVITTAYNSVGVYPTDGASTGMHDRRGGRGQARSVPLALCAAALRARAAMEAGDE